MVRALYSPIAAPEEMSGLGGRRGARHAPRVVADYIAGMTDRFALNEYRRLFDPQAHLR